MRQYGVSWRVWAVLVCLQFATVCTENIQNSIEDNMQDEDNFDTDILARGKKKKKLKYLMPILLGIAVLKAVLIPVALKTMAFISAKAFLLSSLSLILSSILGLKRIASGSWDRMSQISPMRDRDDSTDNSYQPLPTEAVYHKITDHHWARKFHTN
ncbi:hypothetical protein CBL_00629 [Carabus blaptoides fortunei]